MPPAATGNTKQPRYPVPTTGAGPAGVAMSQVLPWAMNSSAALIWGTLPPTHNASLASSRREAQLKVLAWSKDRNSSIRIEAGFPSLTQPTAISSTPPWRHITSGSLSAMQSAMPGKPFTLTFAPLLENSDSLFQPRALPSSFQVRCGSCALNSEMYPRS